MKVIKLAIVSFDNIYMKRPLVYKYYIPERVIVRMFTLRK